MSEIAKKSILLLCHAPSANTLALREAALRGATYPEFDSLQIRCVAPLQAGVDDVLAADALLLGTPENFGYMSGALKDFFDRIYYPCLERTQAMPFCYYVRAGSDGTGSCRAIDAITQSLSWRPIAPPLVCKGDYEPCFAERVEELSATLAAGLDAGLY